MLVKRSNFVFVMNTLKGERELSLDSETTGLRVYHGDKLFSVIISTETDAYYFNFNEYENLDEDWLLSVTHLETLNLELFQNPNIYWFLHNPKFDMGMLAQWGIHLIGPIHDTETGARLEWNEHMVYGLDDCAKRIGLAKSDAVEEYIKQNELWEWEQIPGKKTRTKRKFFNRVPIHIMQAYAEQDALITFKLGKHQLNKFSEIQNSNPTNKPSILNVFTNEMLLTKVCFAMEQTGIKIDRGYCNEAIKYETDRYLRAKAEFEKVSGSEFVDSNKSLERAFANVGETCPRTDKGNPSFTDDVLSSLKSPLAKIVQDYRHSFKRANTYFQSFLYFADSHDSLHANMRQAGTGTGRFSYSDPNLQNLTKGDEKEKFPVRRAFVPRDGFFLTMIDYDQMELRMMLDYAGQLDLIEQIMAGYDPHQATADLVGCERRPAKILNFGILYGMGLALLADTLGCTKDEARMFRFKYFRGLPRVQDFIYSVTGTAERRGFVVNWAGRRSYFPDPKFAYKSPNYVIQGGCADVVKFAMNRLHQYLSDKRSRMLVQVHDEIVFEIHFSEAHIVPQLKKIMEDVYPYKHIPLTCSVSHSLISWGDEIEGMFGEKTGDRVQGSNQTVAETAS